MLTYVRILYKDGTQSDKFLVENFGPMEGSCMIAFYYPSTEGEVPDLMINEDCIKAIEVRKVKERVK